MKLETVNPITKAILPIVQGIWAHPDELEIWERFQDGHLEVHFLRT